MFIIIIIIVIILLVVVVFKLTGLLRPTYNSTDHWYTMQLPTLCRPCLTAVWSLLPVFKTVYFINRFIWQSLNVMYTVVHGVHVADLCSEQNGKAYWLGSWSQALTPCLERIVILSSFNLLWIIWVLTLCLWNKVSPHFTPTVTKDNIHSPT